MYDKTTNLGTVIEEHFQNGRHFQRQGLLEEAAQQFLRVIKLNSRSANAYFNMGAICFQQYRYEEAILYYKAGLELAPQNVSAHADLGKTYEMLAKWDEALYHLNKALDLNPTHEAAKRRKRRIWEEKNRYETLREQVELAIELMMASDKTGAADIELFAINFDEGIAEEFRMPIFYLLRRIYIELGGKFGYYPQKNVKVSVLHASPGEKPQLLFPLWASGYYDGNIVIVWRRAAEKLDLVWLYLILQHEYVHLLVNMLTNARCPIWLNEGLARYYSCGLLNAEREILLQVVRQNRYIPLKDMEYNFSDLNPKQIRLTYMESCSVVEFIMANYGMTRIKKLLHSLGVGESFNESLKHNLGIAKNQNGIVNSSGKELEMQWLTWVMDYYPNEQT